MVIISCASVVQAFFITPHPLSEDPKRSRISNFGTRDATSRGTNVIRTDHLGGFEAEELQFERKVKES